MTTRHVVEYLAGQTLTTKDLTVTITRSRADQYYRMTILLSDRDADIVCRMLVAALLLLVGALPVAMLFTPLGVQGVRATIVTVAIAAVALAMAIMWARPSWPTRPQSIVFLLTAVCCTAVGALQVPDPIAALPASTFFAALTAYAAAFHAPRYTVFTVAAALATAVVAVSRLAAADGIIAATTVGVFVAAVAFATPAVCWTTLRLLGIQSRDGDVDAFTGLLTPAAFSRSVAELIGARTRHDDCRLVLTAVVLDDLPLLSATDGIVGRQRAQVAVADTLRRHTRTPAVQAHLSDELFVVAEVFPATGLVAYAARIQRALSTTTPRMNVSVGIVHTPLADLAHCPPEDTLGALLDVALSLARDHIADAIGPPIATFPMPGTDDSGCLGR